MMGIQYTICHQATNRSDPQNLLSITLDVPLQKGAVSSFPSYYLWEFGSFLCFFSFVVLLLCNLNKIL